MENDELLEEIDEIERANLAADPDHHSKFV
jgi:hypothetical protein